MPKRKITLLFLVALLVFIIFNGISILTFSDKNELVRSDAAIVLGAAVWDKQLSPVLKERVDHSIWLYENGYVAKLIFTGGKGAEDSYAESEVAKNYAISKNVPSSDILIETKSDITEKNLFYAFEVAKEHNLTTFILVSDPLHMKRSSIIAEDLGMEVYSSPTPSSVYKTSKTKIPFFFRELFFLVGHLITYPFR
ncbi:YdcF family protein [Sutcliffiella deserti]|uniref:YdcF family protein n=1 Tax=Sutcliffiella deserti TaxID=2875501 RepID=UPI001CC0AE66|nr:YdcF family protein [Sutcliffiella deserti]